MSSPVVTLVTQPGCNPCGRVKRLLNDLRAEGVEMQLREVVFASDEGRELAETHRIVYPPAVLVDGRLVGKGKILGPELRDAVVRGGAR